jgi:hypothetical protein
MNRKGSLVLVPGKLFWLIKKNDEKLEEILFPIVIDSIEEGGIVKYSLNG